MSNIQKKSCLLMVLAAVAAAAAQTGPGVLDKLRIDKAGAGSEFLSALTSGYVYHADAAKAFKALPALERADVVRAGLGWAKSYVASADFRSSYAKLRQSRMPKPPDPVPSAEERMAKMKADIQKGIENLRKIQATANAEMKKTFEESIKQLEDQLAELDKNPEMMENLRLGVEIEGKSRAESHEAQMKAWNEDLPENPDRLVAKRIRQFLEASANVDYSAALAPRDGKMVFVKDEYEAKPAFWKLCFRAGREATEAARAFAQSWLAELDKQGSN